mgnify:CR=1 FL=1
MRWRGVHQEAVLESRQPIVWAGPDLGENRRAVGVHVGVEDFQRLTNGSGGAGRHPHRSKNVDVLQISESAPKVRDTEHRGRTLHGQHSIPENDEPFVVPDVIGVDACHRQERHGVAAKVGDQRVEAAQTRTPDQQHVLQSKKPVCSGQDSQRFGAAP